VPRSKGAPTADDRAGIRTMREERPLRGVLYAALGAFTFALNNVAMHRGQDG